MKVQKIIIRIAYRVKPILLKVFPVSWLRKIKTKMIQRNFSKLKKLNIKPYEEGRYPMGVNLLGSIRAETGLGQSCRLVAEELLHTGLPMTIYNYIQAGTMRQTNTEYDEYVSEACKYAVNLIHINPHELGLALLHLERKIWDYRYNIGFWLWELEEFPEEWVPCIQCMDEIWTPSEFISCAIRKKTSKPVYTIPYCVTTKQMPECGREAFGLPTDRFLFLMMYDSNSVMERKNPIGVIQAFQNAFSPEDVGVGLVIKVSSAEKGEIAELKEELAEYENIYFITEMMPKEKVNSLIACVDAVVSLHRAEGFGLVMAEAMYMGTPTIATNWSANTEFMNSDVACMVDCRLVEIEETVGPFRKGQRWANPDVDRAALYMRKLYSDREFHGRISRNAKAYVCEKLGMDQAVRKMMERLRLIEGDDR